MHTRTHRRQRIDGEQFLHQRECDTRQQKLVFVCALILVISLDAILFEHLGLGIGRLVVQSILQRDYPVIQGVVLVIVVLYLVVNLIVDLLYGMLDPRIRYE